MISYTPQLEPLLADIKSFFLPRFIFQGDDVAMMNLYI